MSVAPNHVAPHQATHHQVDALRPVRRDALRDFLRSRRARLSPKDVDLPDVGRRRTPGLRREEVALLAGVGVSWYTYLEQGRDITVTPRVLDGISGALRLDADERAHLYRLAGQVPPEHAAGSDHAAGPDHPLPEAVGQILEGWNPNPGYVVDRYWRVVAVNRTLRDLYPEFRPGDSCLDGFDPRSPTRTLIANWSDLAETLVAGLRAQTARFPDDPEFDLIVSRLLATGTEFAGLWARQDVGTTALGTKAVNHPRLGRLQFTRAALQMVDTTEYRIVLLIPTPETQAAIAAGADRPR